jgi:hypothetical protein
MVYMEKYVPILWRLEDTETDKKFTILNVPVAG